MSAPIRFLTLAVLAWVGVRAATLGIIPGAEVFETARAETAPPPIVPTILPPIEPAYAYAPYGAPTHGFDMAYAPPQVRYVAVPYYVPAPAPQHSQPIAQVGYGGLLPEPEPLFYSPIPKLDEWPLSRMASASRNSSPVPTAQPPSSGQLDRLQLTTWALLRGRNGTGSLASGGTLGGSQAGARLTYALDRRLALSLRSSSPVGGSSGGEVAAGVRVTPFPSIPVSLTAERRQAISRFGGRSAFALFVEGGVYQRPLPWDFSLDAYAQAGVVGMRSRDLFADGGMTAMRPIYGPVSAGFGVWGGTQPRLYRIDAGPRLSVRLRRNTRIDLDWRQRLGGHAEPGSGPAITLAGDF